MTGIDTDVAEVLWWAHASNSRVPGVQRLRRGMGRETEQPQEGKAALQSYDPPGGPTRAAACLSCVADRARPMRPERPPAGATAAGTAGAAGTGRHNGRSDGSGRSGRSGHASCAAVKA